jgi:hypothetical protein
MLQTFVSKPEIIQTFHELCKISFPQKFRYLDLIHIAVCLTTGPKPLPKRILHILRSRASSFICEYPLLSLRLSSSFLRLLSRPPPPFYLYFNNLS